MRTAVNIVAPVHAVVDSPRISTFWRWCSLATADVKAAAPRMPILLSVSSSSTQVVSVLLHLLAWGDSGRQAL